jgi:hypothetical protein
MSPLGAPKQLLHRDSLIIEDPQFGQYAISIFS